MDGVPPWKSGLSVTQWDRSGALPAPWCSPPPRGLLQLLDDLALDAIGGRQRFAGGEHLEQLLLGVRIGTCCGKDICRACRVDPYDPRRVGDDRVAAVDRH